MVLISFLYFLNEEPLFKTTRLTQREEVELELRAAAQGRSSGLELRAGAQGDISILQRVKVITFVFLLTPCVHYILTLISHP